MIILKDTGIIKAYDMACGAVQRFEVKQYDHHDTCVIDLWIEHGTYHVRAHDHELHGRLFWDSYDTITAARSRFAKAKRDIKQAMQKQVFNLMSEVEQ